MTKPSPLTEPAETPSLDAFFEREPDELSDAEVDQLVAAMRAQRDAFLAAKPKRRGAKRADEDADDATNDET